MSPYEQRLRRECLTLADIDLQIDSESDELAAAHEAAGRVEERLQVLRRLKSELATLPLFPQEAAA